VRRLAQLEIEDPTRTVGFILAAKFRSATGDPVIAEAAGQTP
jgi:hypothetical protein